MAVSTQPTDFLRFQDLLTDEERPSASRRASS